MEHGGGRGETAKIKIATFIIYNKEIDQSNVDNNPVMPKEFALCMSTILSSLSSLSPHVVSIVVVVEKIKQFIHDPL